VPGQGEGRVSPPDRVTDAADSPPAVAARLAGFRRVPWAVPLNTAHLSRWEGPADQTAILKIGRHLTAERDRLLWLACRLPVPEVLAFGRRDGLDFLRMTEMSGLQGADPVVLAQPAMLVDGLAEALRAVHGVPAADCPFDARTEKLLADAATRARTRLRVEDIDPRYLYRPPADLLADLNRLRPATEDLVLTHGDPSVVNFLFEGTAATGIIDWGLAGVGHRYRDLAIAARSITLNVGASWVGRFFSSYGAEYDRRLVEFFALLDEFVMTRPESDGQG
jgi:aminoglycoside 3'-phosphotransferase II